MRFALLGMMLFVVCGRFIAHAQDPPPPLTTTSVGADVNDDITIDELANRIVGTQPDITLVSESVSTTIANGFFGTVSSELAMGVFENARCRPTNWPCPVKTRRLGSL